MSLHSCNVVSIKQFRYLCKRVLPLFIFIFKILFITALQCPQVQQIGYVDQLMADISFGVISPTQNISCSEGFSSDHFVATSIQCTPNGTWPALPVCDSKCDYHWHTMYTRYNNNYHFYIYSTECIVYILSLIHI